MDRQTAQTNPCGATWECAQRSEGPEQVWQEGAASEGVDGGPKETDKQPGEIFSEAS